MVFLQTLYKMGKQTINGKAFEFACLKAISDRLNQDGKEATIRDTKAFQKAKISFDSLPEDKREKYMLAASTAVKMINGLEPRLIGGEGMLLLEIEPDSVAIGVDGDVRDVLCIRSEEKNDRWEIGMSCKHNHDALKHPRITEGKDFGWDWINIHCSQNFMDAITPITDSLISFGKNNVAWKTIPNKHDTYYVPILQAYLDEIKRMCDVYEDVPSKLLSYFFGSNDFYKVIMQENRKNTIVEGFNMHGTLNKSCGKTKPFIKVPIIKMPTRLLHAEFKISGNKKSKTTIVLTFDEGWAISMRLHNKDEIAKPTSLAWDVKLQGLPPTTYVNTRSWYE